jgi:hypothetical protein
MTDEAGPHAPRLARRTERAWERYASQPQDPADRVWPPSTRTMYQRGYVDGRRDLMAACWGFCTLASALAVLVVLAVTLAVS